MNPEYPPNIRVDQTISNPFRSDRVAGFRGRDTLRGANCIVLKGDQLPGGDGCLGVYNDVHEEILTEGLVLYVLGENTVLGALAEDLDDAPVHTWEEGVPVAGSATMKCVDLDCFTEWDRDDVEVE